VVKYFGYQIDEQKKKLYIVMEYMKGGTLDSIIKKNDQDISFRRKFQWIL
jgi:serine/threonine protein kinase